MEKNIKYICIGHKPPDFQPPLDYLMLCPDSLGLPNELVIRDDRFGHDYDGASLAEYSQLFGLAELIQSGDFEADGLFLFQYRKFLSPIDEGYQSIAPWIKVLSPNNAADIFPRKENFDNSSAPLIVGSVFNFGESISDNYSKAHVTEDLVTFAAACAQSEAITPTDIKLLASMHGIIPSPALCYISAELFLDLMTPLKKACEEFMNHYHVKRTGYQSRSTGYLLERLHSLLICQKIMNASMRNPTIWNRYVINTEI
jgi:hypothetical protein